jgi:hypothetical protein
MKEDLGEGLVMMSRAGRSTTQHFLAFQTAASKDKVVKGDDEYGDNFHHMVMGDSNKQDLHSKIAGILNDDPENNKEVKRRGLAEKFLLALNDNLPTDYKQEKFDGRPLPKSAAFVSPSRDEWIESHARRMEPPDLTKYTPRLQIVRRKPKAAVIHSVHQNDGEERKNQKYKAQLNFCDRLALAMMDKTRGAREDLHAQIHEQKEKNDSDSECGESNPLDSLNDTGFKKPPRTQ